MWMSQGCYGRYSVYKCQIIIITVQIVRKLQSKRFIKMSVIK